MPTPERRLPSSLVLVLVVGTLALTACNSNSGPQRTSGAGNNTVTGAQIPAPSNAPAKGTIAEALARQL